MHFQPCLGSETLTDIEILAQFWIKDMIYLNVYTIITETHDRRLFRQCHINPQPDKLKYHYSHLDAPFIIH